MRLDPFFAELNFMPDCDKKLEADYNNYVGEKAGFVCLDTANMTPKGQGQIEPCDLYRIDDNHGMLIHVKISTVSSLLSHLFNQGANSVELLKSEDRAVEKLIALLEEKSGEGADVQTLTAPVRAGLYKVVFAIVTRKSAEKRALNLPLFSRISLARNIKALDKIMAVPVVFGFIKDISPEKPPRLRKQKVATDVKKN